MSYGESRYDASGGPATLDDGSPGVVLKIQCRDFELNVWLRLTELPLLRRVPSTPWESGAIPIGKSASSTAFWSCDDARVSVVVGGDDETWDFGVSFPESTFEELLIDIEKEVGP